MLTSPTIPKQRALLVVVLLAVFGYLLFCAREPLRLNWGDPWSDANVLTALNYSSKYGFLKTSFTDILDVGPLTRDSYRYTHYPPFSEIFYGCVRKLAGGAALDISVYRVFGIAFSAVALNGLFRYVNNLWGRGLAHWATALCATNLLWLQFADSMHQAPVLFATGMVALAAVPAWINTSRRVDLVQIAVGTYFCFLTAYDYYFFLPTVALLTARVLGVPLLSKKMIKLAAIVALSGAVAIATKSAFVSGALGWQGFLQDVHFQFLERATTKFSPDYRSGFLIIIFTRWSSYFTPAAFVVAVVLLAHMLRSVTSFGLGASLRALLFGSEDLREHPGSILILLAGGLPFIVVFSELSVEQVLPSQVMVPFYSVGCAYGLMWLAKRSPAYAYAGFAAVLVWQGAHFARVPKAFLEREVTAQIGEYLDKNDTADFLVTNLMSDGPVQYFFDRHLHPPADIVERTPAGYLELATKTQSGIIHAVYFEDPNGRFIDKSLWSLLPQHSRWAVFGMPYVLRERALDAIREWDGRVLEGLRRSGTEVARFPGVRIFRIGVDVPARRIENAKLLTETTRTIDFGTKESDVHKLSGFRFRENYPGVPGFCWTVGRSLQRTILTKRGIIYRTDQPPIYEAALLVRFDPSRDQKVSLVTWGSIDHQTLSASIDGVTVLAPKDLGMGQTRSTVSFVVPKELLLGDPVKVIDWKFRDVADYGGGVSFATMSIDPVDGT